MNLVSTPYYENVDAALYATHKRILKEDRKSQARECPTLHVLRFLPDSQDAAMHASNGSRVTKKLWSIDDIVALLDLGQIHGDRKSDLCLSDQLGDFVN